MDDFRFESVWPNPDEVTRTDAVEFWLNEGALPEGVAIERSRQQLVLARDVNGKLAGVSTAVRHYVEFLGIRLFFFRAYVGKENRLRGLKGTGLIQSLIRNSYDSLEKRFDAGVDPDVLGLYLEIQNTSAINRRRRLVWNELGANIVYAGERANGAHARVWYFRDAMLPQR